MRGAFVLTAVLVAGCGRFGFDSFDPVSEVSSDDSNFGLRDGGTTPGTPDGAASSPDAPGTPGTDASPMGSCAGYSAIAGGQTGSTYRVIATPATFWSHHADCNNDNPGSTHLAALQTSAEGSAVVAIAGGVDIYVGAVQRPGQTDPSNNWDWLTGHHMTFGWAANEPEDGVDDVENGEEQLMLLTPTMHGRDTTGTLLAPAVCECDGLAISGSIVIPPEP
ncbi:MAG: hypothetical protein AB7P03_20325 [Kofleriaceae bacterium]